MWTQPPYNDRNSLLFLIPPKLKQSKLSSHFDFGVNNQRSLPPSIPRLRWDPWERHRTPKCSPGAVAIWLPTAPGLCSRCVCECVFTTLCVHLNGLNAEHNFRVWVTIWPHATSLSLNWFISGSANHCTLDCFLNEGQFKAGFVKKVKTQGWITSTEERGGVSRTHSHVKRFAPKQVTVNSCFWPGKRGVVLHDHWDH